MSSQKIKKLIKSLETEITSFWAKHCFHYVGDHEWLRRWGWKTDRIRINPKGDYNIIINFEVLIPPIPKTNFDFDDVGIINLAVLSNRPGKDFHFPTFSWSYSRFIKRIMSDMPLAVDWFSRYDTPKLCLDHLLTPHVNPNSVGFKYREDFLRSLACDVENCSCLLNFDHEYPNPYSKAIFDIHYRGQLPEPKDEYYNFG